MEVERVHVSFSLSITLPTAPEHVSKLPTEMENKQLEPYSKKDNTLTLPTSLHYERSRGIKQEYDQPVPVEEAEAAVNH